jgi:hypothetical protein
VPKPLTEQECLEGETALAKKHFDMHLEFSAERFRQNWKFTKSPIGVQHHNIMTWALILGEESGEAQQAALQTMFDTKDEAQARRLAEFREELVQVGAVCYAIIERIDAKDPSLLEPEGKYGHDIRP